MVGSPTGFATQALVQPSDMANPIGTITLWSGSVATIQINWQLCDGTNGTPDLRDRFVKAAGGARNPGDLGGNATHTHVFTGVAHFHSEAPTVTVPVAPGTAVLASSPPPARSGTGTGTNANTDHTPLFHALAYIMRLS